MPRQYTRGLFPRICRHCGAEFSVRANIVRWGWGIYCSQSCFGLARHHRVYLTCEVCHVEFWTWPSWLAEGKGRGRFCSAACKAIGRAASTLHERFWKRVEKGGGPDACWLWTGPLSGCGYGKTGESAFGQRRVLRANRAALEMVAGPLPLGMMALHTCDVRTCVRNDEPGIYVVRGIARPRWGHLWMGNHRDNMADMATKGRGKHTLKRATAH
jgi:hypothetical protein